MLIVGGGPVGVEFATIAHALGAKVTIADRGDRLMSMMDGEIAACMEELFRAWGIRVLFGSTCDSIAAKNGALEVKMSTGETLSPDTVLFAAGRIPNTEGLGSRRGGCRRGRPRADRRGPALSHVGGRSVRGGRCSRTDSRLDRDGAWPRGGLPCFRHSLRGNRGPGSGIRGLRHARGFGRGSHRGAVPRKGPRLRGWTSGSRPHSARRNRRTRRTIEADLPETGSQAGRRALHRRHRLGNCRDRPDGHPLRRHDEYHREYVAQHADL